METPASPPNNRAGDMLSEVLKNESLFQDLYKIDLATAEQYRQMKCPHCQGPLYYANYPRKPRGEPDGVSEKYFLQFSLCCGAQGCRRRLIPPTCRFLGKKYTGMLQLLQLYRTGRTRPTALRFPSLLKKPGFPVTRLNAGSIGLKRYFQQALNGKKSEAESLQT